MGGSVDGSASYASACPLGCLQACLSACLVVQVSTWGRAEGAGVPASRVQSTNGRALGNGPTHPSAREHAPHGAAHAAWRHLQCCVRQSALVRLRLNVPRCQRRPLWRSPLANSASDTPPRALRPLQCDHSLPGAWPRLRGGRGEGAGAQEQRKEASSASRALEQRASNCPCHSSLGWPRCLSGSLSGCRGVGASAWVLACVPACVYAWRRGRQGRARDGGAFCLCHDAGTHADSPPAGQADSNTPRRPHMREYRHRDAETLPYQAEIQHHPSPVPLLLFTTRTRTQPLSQPARQACRYPGTHTGQPRDTGTPIYWSTGRVRPNSYPRLSVGAINCKTIMP